MGNFAPAQVVDGITRQPLPFGLLSVLTPRTTADVHWQNGTQWEALGCDPVSGIGDPECADSEEETIGLPKSFQRGGLLGEASAFTVYGSYVCTPVGHTVQYAQDRATEHLLAREQARVEQAFWTGDLGNTPNLRGATDQNPSGAADPVAAVGLLEDFIAETYGSLGVLHMTRAVANAAIAAGSVLVSGSRLLTNLGTLVVAGAGYDGSSPAGAPAADGESWVYATPALVGYQSEVFPGTDPVAAGFDKSNNDLHAVAERTYLLGFDPCGVGAVRTTYGCACA